MPTSPSPRWTCTGCWGKHDGDGFSDHPHDECKKRRDATCRKHILTYARAVYRTMGVLPLHVAFELMDAGFIVRELEEQWDRELAR